MDKIFDSLNYLGNTAWKINEPILDMMIMLYNTTGDMKLDIIGPNLPNIERVNAKYVTLTNILIPRFQLKVLKVSNFASLDFFLCFFQNWILKIPK